MSDKSGGFEQILSLPKGGGAIKGIGETFQPNLFSGTGNFSIPIFTSPGRGGFGPQLTLQYSTGNGNGPFGLGWNLSIPRITRKTEKGLPKYTDEDVFVMSGAEDLVVSDNQIDEANQPAEYQITRYCPRTEGLFARIEKWVKKNDPTGIHWRATTKENITRIYGKTTQARIFDPEHQHHIYEWLLEESFDAKGNHILYEYAKEDKALEPNHIYETNRSYESQRYIRRIFYGNALKGVDVSPCRQGTNYLENYASIKDPSIKDPIERHYLFEVQFDYSVLEENEKPAYTDPPEIGTVETIKDWPIRDDPFSSFRSGFEIRTLRRCERVLMFHHFRELGGPTLVKSTDFTYENDPQTRLSILSSATISGYQKAENDDSYTSSSMPPVTFKYSQFTPYEQKYQSVTARGDDMPPVSLKDPQTTLVDLCGDGLPDVLNTTETGYYFWQNLGNGQLDMRHPQHTVPAGIALSQPGVAFGDMGGDGMADLIVQWPEMAGFYESTPDGNWKPFKKFNTYPSFNLADPNVRLTDLTGDGRSDVLMTRDRHFLWFECLGEAGYAEPRSVMREHNLEDFPDVYFNDPSARVRLADMTGDGLNDIVLLHNGRIDYWPNLGYGEFGKRITMKGSPRLEYNFDPARLFLADIDGSGCTDLVYVDTGKVHCWFNQSGNGWSEEQVIHGTPPVTNFDSVQFADIFGTGTATLVWSYDYGRYPGENYKALDLCGGKKPYVLSEMSNNMGATTKVQYAPSTKFYLEDKKNGTPWVTNLPFPVHVVEKVEVIDHISKTKLVTTYKYHHGYYDGREREFRGFGRVDQFDTETFDDFTSPGLHGDDQSFTNNDQVFHVPPVETRSWFHTGVYFDEDKLGEDGEPFDHHKLMEAYKQEFYTGDAKAFPMEDQVFKSHTSGDDMEAPHEIFRALRGAMLRTEVYTGDGSEKEAHPYVVTQNRYLITEIQPKGENPHAVYLTTQKESLSYHYERNPDDPRVGHEITLKVDSFGNVTDKISIGYPRRIVPENLKEQGELQILYSWSNYINKPDEKDFYYIGIPCESKTFEVTGIEWTWDTDDHLTADDFTAVIDSSDFKPYEWTRPEGHPDVEKRLIEWTRTYFRRNTSPDVIDSVTPADSGNPLPHRLSFGEIESLGLPYETYQAVFTSTDALIDQLKCVDENGNVLFEPHFQIDNQLHKTEGGYHQEPDITAYWWIPSGRQGFNAGKFYLPEKTQDPFGNKSSMEYDQYGLLMTKAVDPLGNTIEAKNNYRVLQPFKITDPNQNISEVRFDRLGMVVGTALMGKVTENKGDSLDNFQQDLPHQQIKDYLNSPKLHGATLLSKASSRIVYDLKAYDRGLKQNPPVIQPPVAATLSREIHYSDPGGENSPIQHSFLYSDGFGREVQTKVQAEPGDANKIDSDGYLVTEHAKSRWVGTGRKIYNNKGKPVKQYEPFFSHTPGYEHETAIVEWGVTPVLFYDPLERVICTVHPNHTYEKVVFDPWYQETWDVNDTVLLLPQEDKHVKGYAGTYILNQENGFKTWYDQRIEDKDNPPNINRATPEQRAALLTIAHSRTPGRAYLDSLGRPFLTVANNGLDKNNKLQLFENRVKLDIEGNDLKIFDPRNKRFDDNRPTGKRPVAAFIHRFDIAGRKIFVNSVDAGRSALLTDIVGNPIRSQDANGNWTSVKYDELRRPTKTIINRTTPYDDIITSQVMVYGESLDEEIAITKKLRGQVYAAFDGAGAVFNLAYDFKANLLKSSRRLTLNYKADEIDWIQIPTIDFTKEDAIVENSLKTLLEQDTYLTTTEYDALNRITISTAPDHSTFTPTPGVAEPTNGSKYIYGYNEANLLESVTVNLKQEDGSRVDQVFVSNINYNARGQRERIVYGNDVETTYTYDPQTFRLIKLKSNKSDGTKVQELSYIYDPVGNIIQIYDGVFKSVFNRNNEIKPESCYTYDPTYRLIEATGREHEAMTACHYKEKDKKQTGFIGLTNQPTNDGQALGKYTEKYEYDPSGNITLIDHINHTYNKHWKRYQNYAGASNRLISSGAYEQNYNPDFTEIISQNRICDNDGNIPHDPNGNITKLPHLPQMIWDEKNQLVQVQLNAGDTPNMAYYQYDAAGQRVRKTVVKGSTIEERIYLGGFEIYRKRNGQNGSDLKLERQTLHVMDDKQRIALVETRTAGNDPEDSRWRRFRYQLDNHLGSSVMEIEWEQDRHGDWQAEILSYEEYYPYGDTSYIAGRSKDNEIAPEVKRKRYRYSGKERDDETGLYYYGARYYAPWMGRWVSCDPAGTVDGLNLFLFVGNNPINIFDKEGFNGVPSQNITESETPEEYRNFWVTVKNINNTAKRERERERKKHYQDNIPPPEDLTMKLEVPNHENNSDIIDPGLGLEFSDEKFMSFLKEINPENLKKTSMCYGDTGFSLGAGINYSGSTKYYPIPRHYLMYDCLTGEWVFRNELNIKSGKSSKMIKLKARIEFRSATLDAPLSTWKRTYYQSVDITFRKNVGMRIGSAHKSGNTFWDPVERIKGLELGATFGLDKLPTGKNIEGANIGVRIQPFRSQAMWRGEYTGKTYGRAEIRTKNKYLFASSTVILNPWAPYFFFSYAVMQDSGLLD